MSSLAFVLCDLDNNKNVFSANDECEDLSSRCDSFLHLCSNTTPQNWWVQKNCRETCGLCGMYSFNTLYPENLINYCGGTWPCSQSAIIKKMAVCRS